MRSARWHTGGKAREIFLGPVAVVGVGVILALTGASGLAADTDIAVVDIDFRLDQLVVPQGDTVDVTTLVANLGDVLINEVGVQYIYYVNEVISELKWKVPEAQSVYELASGEVGVSTAYRWDTTLVDPGRYHFVARASIVDGGLTDTVLCNDTFPAKEDCEYDEKDQLIEDEILEPVQSIVVRVPGVPDGQSDDDDVFLIQPLIENDPNPIGAETRIPEACILDYRSGDYYGDTEVYRVPVVNLGNEDLPQEADVTVKTRGDKDDDWEEQDEALQDATFVPVQEEGTADNVTEPGDRALFKFALDLGFLVETHGLGGSRDFNAADSYPLQLRLEFFPPDSDEDEPAGYNASDYNWLELPLAADQMLDVYPPVIEWLYPGCGDSGSDRPLDVSPGALLVTDPVSQGRFYVPVASTAGEHALLVVNQRDRDKEVLSRVGGLPGEVVGLTVDSSAKWVYLSCSDSDGFVVAVDDAFAGESQDAATIAWNESVGTNLTAPVLYESGERKYVFVGASDGLHARFAENGEKIERSAVNGEPIEIGHVAQGLPVSRPPVVVGDRVFFASGPRMGRVDPASNDEDWKWESITVAEITSPLVSMDLGENGCFVFFGTSDGFVYALGEDEPLTTLGGPERTVEVRVSAPKRVTALVGSADDGGGVLYAGTNGGQVYRVGFDPDGGFDEPTGFPEDPEDEETWSAPTGAIDGLAVYPGGDDADDMVFVSSENGELFGYTVDLKKQLDCSLWGGAATAPFSLSRDSGLGLPAVLPDAKFLFIRSGDGILYGLDLEFIKEPK